jgi:cell division protein FtsL
MTSKNANAVRSMKMTGLWFMLMSVFIAELLFYTWIRVQCTQIGYEINQATETYQQRVTMQNNLKIESARLKSPERIAAIAQQKLGLHVPKPEQIVIMP